MSVALHIARRYLFSKKGHNAINVVSGVSAAAVAVVTAAMICVMSVMNGFGTVIEGMFSDMDPDLRIQSVSGSSFATDTPVFDRIRTLEYVHTFSEVVEATALVEYNNQQIPAVLKGVDSTYQHLTRIDSIIVDGYYSVRDGDFYNAVMGIGLSNQLGVSAHFVHPLHLYAPKRHGEINRFRPEDSFNRNTCFMAGVFAVNQTKYDDRLMLVALPLARQLFDYGEHEVTSVEVKVNGDLSVAKKRIRTLIGDDYLVLDRYEQQADFFRILRIEKWLTALLLVFIMLIASFNIIGSLTMLIIDKQDDIRILRDLGADNRLIRLIFLLEGWLISAVGVAIGLVTGVALCLIQEHYGLIKLGDGTQYVLSSYPVHVEIPDLAIITLIVLSLGFVAAWFPTRHINPLDKTD